MTEDKGKPGRTPKSQRWFSPKVETGWKKTQNPETRRKQILDATDKAKSLHDRYVQAGRMIQQLANVTVDEETKREAKADADYFYEMAKESK